VVFSTLAESRPQRFRVANAGWASKRFVVNPTFSAQGSAKSSAVRDGPPYLQPPLIARSHPGLRIQNLILNVAET
jgi:hypothetical protein